LRFVPQLRFRGSVGSIVRSLKHHGILLERDGRVRVTQVSLAEQTRRARRTRSDGVYRTRFAVDDDGVELARRVIDFGRERRVRIRPLTQARWLPRKLT